MIKDLINGKETSNIETEKILNKEIIEKGPIINFRDQNELSLQIKHEVFKWIEIFIIQDFWRQKSQLSCEILLLKMIFGWFLKSLEF